ncbi:MAG: hypothetical protein ACQERC_05215 [Bacteroidota bacterium]
MPKTASPILHELIHNLSKSEKRYFKLHASRHTIGKENNYVKIFDYIAQQRDYDEELLFKHFQGASFLNQFSITKKRLYDQIIKALNSYHTDNSITSNIYKNLHSAEVLYKKGLYEHALRQLKSAQRIAIKHEKITLLQKIELEIDQITESTGYTTTSEEELEQQTAAWKDMNAAQVYYKELWLLKSKLFMRLNRLGPSRSEADQQSFESIYQSYQQLSRPNFTSFENEYLANHFESAYYYAVLDKAKSLNYLKKNMDLFQSHSDKIKQLPHLYLSLLTNIIHLESTTGEEKNIHAYLGELRTMKQRYKISSDEDFDIKHFSSAISIELLIYIQQARFEKAIALEQKIIDGMQLYEHGITPIRKAYLYFNLGIAFFGYEDYNSSLKWINAILNAPDLNQKEDILIYAQLLHLIIHYELNSEQLLPYAIKNTLRQIRKHGGDASFESTFISYLRKVINAKSTFESETILRKAVEELTTFSKNPYSTVAFEYFDFKSWMLSKIKGKGFQAIKREAYLNKSA